MVKLVDMINQIKEKGYIEDEVIKAMNNVKAIGNKAVHAGKIELDDATNPEVLFSITRYIVQNAISQHIAAAKINQMLEKDLNIRKRDKE